MSSNKHVKSARPSDADLRGDPGIGSTRGTEQEDGELEGENTFEGDVLNDTTPAGGINPRQTGRTNK